MSRPFYSDCVGWQPDRLDVLLLLQEEADDITLEDLRERIGEDSWNDLVSNLGYAAGDESGLRIENDYHVSYHLHAPSGIPFVKHSAIEYVFAEIDEIEVLYDRTLEEDDDLEVEF
jgi:hypothetical protein